MTPSKKLLRAAVFTLATFFLPSTLFAAELLCYYGDEQGNPVKIHAGYNVAGHTVVRSETAFFSHSFYVSDHDTYEDLLNICQKLSPGKTISNMRINETLTGTANIFWPENKTEKPKKYPFNRVIALGDSLTDEANTLRYLEKMHKTVPGSLYWVWRFSNGFVWADYLSQALHLPKTNLAYGGATTFNDGEATASLDDNDTVPSLHDQVDFLAELSEKNKTIEEAIPTSLFTIFIGGNDFFFTDHTPDEMAAQLEKTLNHLYNLGARYFFVVNLPDLSALPLYEDATDEGKNILDEETHEYNQKMTVIVNQLKAKSGVQVYFYDVNNDFHRILNNEQPGFPALTPTNCINVFSQPANEAARVCEHPETHAFWDEIHPTTTMHCLMGNLAMQHIDPDYTFDPQQCISTIIQTQ